MPSDGSATATEAFRHACEVAHWLDRTAWRPHEVKDLIERIAKRRGQAAADRLLEGMREEWRRRGGNKGGGNNNKVENNNKTV